MPTAIGVGQFKNAGQTVYVAGDARRLENFSSLDGLRRRVAGVDEIYGLNLPDSRPRIYPLGPSEMEYITKK
ncbi:MAG: hypothetical protein HYT72_01560 [Candidatus Aenigmarchaeota archaeon]|nr:hypothetical protein [Candidatus Aenigmarchaeota archaeon]